MPRYFASLLLAIVSITIVGPTLAESAAPVDRARLRELVRAERFEELERELDAAQRDYEADWRGEDRLVGMFNSLRDPDERLTAILHRWASERPASHSARLAYGLHLKELGSVYRGSAYIQTTPRWRLQAWERYHEAARAELQAAASLTAKPSLAYAALISMSRVGIGGVDPRELLHRALAFDPYSGEVMSDFRFLLHPSWSGGRLPDNDDPWAQMAAFVEATEARLRGTPAEGIGRALRASMLIDQAVQVHGQSKQAAIGMYERAFALHPNINAAAYLAIDHCMADRCDEALALIDRAIERRPHRGDLWRQRAWILLRMNRVNDALEARRTGARLGDRDSQNELGAGYASGAWGLTRDPKQALYWYTEAASAFYAPGMIQLARAYYDGFAGAPDDDAAWRWWRRAQSFGDDQATKDIAHARANNRLPKDPALLVDPAPPKLGFRDQGDWRLLLIRELAERGYESLQRVDRTALQAVSAMALLALAAVIGLRLRRR